MLIPSENNDTNIPRTSLSRRVNANSQHDERGSCVESKLIKKGEC